VLVVEDEPMVRDIVVRVLRDQGYRVLAAADGPEGERIAGAHGAEIDLLLTDVVMPGFNGCELYRRLSSQLPQLDVLYMSGYADGVVLRQGLLDPDASRISKPFAPLALAKRVREVLDGKGTRA
jgi:CheY-like chemotaxis protein